MKANSEMRERIRGQSSFGKNRGSSHNLLGTTPRCDDDDDVDPPPPPKLEVLLALIGDPTDTGVVAVAALCPLPGTEAERGVGNVFAGVEVDEEVVFEDMSGGRMTGG